MLTRSEPPHLIRTRDHTYICPPLEDALAIDNLEIQEVHATVIDDSGALNNVRVPYPMPASIPLPPTGLGRHGSRRVGLSEVWLELDKKKKFVGLVALYDTTGRVPQAFKKATH